MKAYIVCDECGEPTTPGLTIVDLDRDRIVCIPCDTAATCACKSCEAIIAAIYGMPA